MIRRAVPADAETLARIGAETFIQTFGHLYREEDLSAFLRKSHSAETYRGLLAREDCALWLAETEGGAAAGYAVAAPCGLPVPNRPENAGELARLYLLQGEQGAGLGSRLLSAALDWLEARFERVYLSVYAENVGAQRLYARHGFVKIHDYFYMVGEHADPEWIMELRPPVPAAGRAE